MALPPGVDGEGAEEVVGYGVTNQQQQAGDYKRGPAISSDVKP